jgi:cellulose synthase/poly-beta-1,6-N-acetylglucosamine synthase-like glycosyltransferase
MWLTVAVALSAVALVLVAASGYLLVLTIAATLARRRGPLPDPNTRRFAILVPAHDEEVLIGRLLANLRELKYPAASFDVHVVADNCSDRTAAIARSFGVGVHERFDERQKAKGFALRWLIHCLRTEHLQYDAYVVLDADSVVAPNFLEAFNARLGAGSQAMQAYYSVLNAGQSPVASLRYAALAALHYLRPLGRSVFGLSSGLKGNGMCFAGDVLERFGWDWFTLAEDVEFHLALVRAGVRVDFVPETWVLADMPVTLAQAASQNDRWERGRLQLLRGQASGLLLDGLRRHSWLRVDAAIEQLIPPLSVAVALDIACLAASAAFGLVVPAVLAAAALLGQLGYLLAGLLLVRAPLRMYVSLGFAPLYIAWKVGLYAQALVGARGRGWVRTTRAGL